MATERLPYEAFHEKGSIEGSFVHPLIQITAYVAEDTLFIAW